LRNLEDIGLVINLFMLCETILSYINMFPIRGNQFVCNNHKLGRDGGGGCSLY